MKNIIQRYKHMIYIKVCFLIVKMGANSARQCQRKMFSLRIDAVFGYTPFIIIFPIQYQSLHNLWVEQFINFSFIQIRILLVFFLI